MDPRSIPKGSSPEQNTERNPNLPGIYEHKAASEAQGEPVRIITDPGHEGYVQADALVQVGYVRVGDVPSREELLKMRQAKEAEARAEAAAEKAAVKVAEDEAYAAANKKTSK